MLQWAKKNNVSFAVILLLFLTLNFVAAFMTPIVFRKESRRPEVCREMARSGNWWSPTLQGQPFFTKPPLYYWGGAAIYKLTGSDKITAVRAVHMLSTVAVFSFFILRMRQSLLEAISVCGVLMTMYMFHLHSMSTDMDMLMTACVTLSFFILKEYLTTFKRRHLLFGGLFFAAGLMVKGPIVGLFTVVPLGIWFLLHNTRSGLSGMISQLKRIHWTVLIVVLGLAVAPWYLYSNQSAASMQSTMGESLGHMSHFGLFPSLWYYTWNWMVCTFPWGILLFCFFKASRKEFSAEWIQLAVSFFGMSLFVKSDIKYLIPIFPTAAYIVGMHLESLNQLTMKSWFRACDKIVMGLYALILGVALYIIMKLQSLILATGVFFSVTILGYLLWRSLPKLVLVRHVFCLLMLFTMVNVYVSQYGHGPFYDHFFKMVKTQYPNDCIVDINFPDYGASLNLGRTIPDVEEIEDIPLGALLLYKTKDEEDPFLAENDMVYRYTAAQHFGNTHQKSFPYSLIPKYDLYLLRKVKKNHGSQ